MNKTYTINQLMRKTVKQLKEIYAKEYGRVVVMGDQSKYALAIRILEAQEKR